MCVTPKSSVRTANANTTVELCSDVRVVMDVSENLCASKVNELLRNRYGVRPMIRRRSFAKNSAKSSKARTFQNSKRVIFLAVLGTLRFKLKRVVNVRCQQI